MKLILLFLLTLPVFAMETDVSRLAEEVKARKALLLEFRKMVSHGEKCRVRDYACFSQQVKSMLKGQTEDIIQARLVLEPFYLRSIKEGFPPCSAACQNTMKAQHINLFLDYILTYNTLEKENYRVVPFPTVSATKIRAYMDLSAFQKTQDFSSYLTFLLSDLNFDKITVPELKKKKEEFASRLSIITNGELFSNSVLCHLSQGDLIYDDIIKKAKSGKAIDKDYALALMEFESKGTQKCTDRKPLDYRGIDSSTRKHYGGIFDRKMAAIDCAAGDFACVRKHLRGLTIRYALDVEKVKTFMERFVKGSRPDKCDDSCEAQLLVKTVQTWVTFLSKFDRKKLGSTMDWNEFPEARYLTINEDIFFYELLFTIFTPMLEKFGSLDASKLKDEGLKSEVRSVGKDLSDLASGKMLKDTVVCTMDPWKAEYDKYMKPFKSPKRNKAFEKAFIEFRTEFCK